MIGRLLVHSELQATERYAYLDRDWVRETAVRISKSIASDILAGYSGAEGASFRGGASKDAGERGRNAHETRCGAGSCTFPPGRMTDSRMPKEQEARSTLLAATQFANEVAWKRPDLNILRQEYEGQYSHFVEIVQEKILMSHKRGRLILPNLAAFGNNVVGVFSDYGGEHKESRYLTYSVLICTFDLRDLLSEKIQTYARNINWEARKLPIRTLEWARYSALCPIIF